MDLWDFGEDFQLAVLGQYLQIRSCLLPMSMLKRKQEELLNEQLKMRLKNKYSV
jgi:hypothetical protein